MPHDGISPYVPMLIFCIFVLSFMIVGGIIAMVIYVKWNNKQIKQNMEEQSHRELEAFKQSLSSANKQMADKVINAFHGGEQYHSARENLASTFTKLGKIIKDDLYDMMITTKACRAALYLYHNGTHSNSGLNFLKVSCIGERTQIGSGVQEQILNHSNMQINLLDDMTEVLMRNGKYVIMNDNDTMSSARRQFISAPKIKYSQAISIYDNSNNILGFILVEFDHTYSKSVADAEYSIISGLANKISPILSFTEYAELALNSEFSTIVG